MTTTTPPAFAQTTRLVARSLGLTPAALLESLRPARLADLPHIVELRRRHYGDKRPWDDTEYLQWRYKLGCIDSGMGELWVFFKDAELLGMVGAEDMVCRIGGQRYAGTRSMDILVDAGVRESGLGIWMNQAMFEKSDFTLAVGAGSESAGMLRRLFHALPPRMRGISYIDGSDLLHRRLGNNALVAVPITLGNAALRMWRATQSLQLARDIKIRAIEEFDATHIASAPEDADAVHIERSAAYMNYRLFQNPRARYEVAGAYLAGNYLGHIAWRIAKNSDEHAWCYVIDVQTFGSRRDDALFALLVHVEKLAAAAGCMYTSLALQSRSDWPVFKRAGFVARDFGTGGLIALQCRDPATLEVLGTARWSITDLSEDNDGY